MPFLLIDENLSPHLAEHLRRQGYDAQAVRDIGLKGQPDRAVAEWLKQRGGVIITGDLDFGEYFYWLAEKEIGVVMLRLRSQDAAAQKAVIDFLHSEGILKDKRISRALVIARENSYRLRLY